jgi:hypothetical protein
MTSKSKHSVTKPLLEESQLAKRVDAAILSQDNNFLVQALLSSDTQLVKVVHSRVHAFCEMKSALCYT